MVKKKEDHGVNKKKHSVIQNDSKPMTPMSLKALEFFEDQ
jgi:hypothetical protein